MKVKELIAVLKKVDGDLEVMKLESELCAYLPLQDDEIQGETDVYGMNGEFHQASDAVEICECNEEEFDDSKVKKVFIL